MLKFIDFAQITDITPFCFEQLHLVTIDGPLKSIYSDNRGNRYCVIIFGAEQLQQLKTIDYLGTRKIIINYKGSLQFIKADNSFKSSKNQSQSNSGKYFIFSSMNQYTSLAAYVQTFNTNTKLMDEKFCSQLIESILLFFIELEKIGCHFKIIDPYIIGVKNEARQNNVSFGLLYPFPQRFFTQFTFDQYHKSLVFCAPEIIRYFNDFLSSKKIKSIDIICGKQFRKSCLYSLGLVILFCFNHTFSAQQRVESSKNDRELKPILKKIRKQIKILHKGKYISKVLKLLLEDCEKSRETLQTFDIKIHSTQFKSLRVRKDYLSMNQIKVSTILTHTENIDPTKKKIIEIQIGTIYGSPKSPSLQSYISEHNTPKSMKVMKLLKQQKTEQLQQQSKSQRANSIQSPIDIDIELTQSQDQDTPRYGMIKMLSNHSKKSIKNSNTSKLSQKQKSTDIGNTIQEQKQKRNEKLCISPKFGASEAMIQNSIKQAEEQQQQDIIRYSVLNQIGLYQNYSHRNKNKKIDYNIHSKQFQPSIQSSISFSHNEDISENINSMQFGIQQEIKSEVLLETEKDKEIYEEQELIEMQRESTIRQNFQNQSKIIIGIVLFIVVLYEIVAEIRLQLDDS